MLPKGNVSKKATWPGGELMGGQDVKHGEHLSSKKTHRDKNGSSGAKNKWYLRKVYDQRQANPCQSTVNSGMRQNPRKSWTFQPSQGLQPLCQHLVFIYIKNHAMATPAKISAG